VLVALGPAFGERLASVRAALGAMLGSPVLESSDIRQLAGVKRAALWLRDASPATQGYLDASQEPEYGVISAWGNGHLVRYYAERPMLQDNFGPYAGREGFDAARAYYESTSEEAALEIARHNRARYVVATPSGSGQVVPAPESMAARLTLARTAQGALALPAHALAHHRLSFVADDGAHAYPTGDSTWSVAVYEIVDGARVSGRAPAGAQLRFELPLYVGDGRTLAWIARTQADATGRYEVRLPYPTGHVAGAHGVRSGARYRVRSGARSQSLTLSRADVDEGRSVAGPDFTP
jgi:asparagine N-glycosylation enzyme membrane subunit Stt3